MLKPNAKTLARKEAFRKLGQAISARGRRTGPTLFNPHYAIAGRALQDRALSHPVGPRMNTMQWEPTGRSR